MVLGPLTFEKALKKKYFPELELVEIPSNHKLYSPDLLHFLNGIPKNSRNTTKKKGARLLGYFYEGRLIVFFMIMKTDFK